MEKKDKKSSGVEFTASQPAVFLSNFRQENFPLERKKGQGNKKGKKKYEPLAT